jgi:hypothetical protein
MYVACYKIVVEDMGSALDKIYCAHTVGTVGDSPHHHHTRRLNDGFEYITMGADLSESQRMKWHILRA